MRTLAVSGKRWKMLRLPNGTIVLPLSGNPRCALAFGKKTLSSWLCFNCRIGPSVCRFAAGVKVIELSGKRFSDRACFVVVKNVCTHVWERQAVERSRVCLRPKSYTFWCDQLNNHFKFSICYIFLLLWLLYIMFD